MSGLQCPLLTMIRGVSSRKPARMENMGGSGRSEVERAD